MAGRNERELAWNVQPVRRRPGRGILAVTVSAVAVVVAWVWAGPVLGAVALLVLAASLGPFFVCTRYRLTPRGVEVHSPFQRLRREWSAFRRMREDPASGVFLSPYPRPRFLDAYRGVLLRYDGNREDVLAWVRRFGPGGRVGREEQP